MLRPFVRESKQKNVYREMKRAKNIRAVSRLQKIVILRLRNSLSRTLAKRCPPVELILHLHKRVLNRRDFATQRRGLLVLKQRAAKIVANNQKNVCTNKLLV